MEIDNNKDQNIQNDTYSPQIVITDVDHNIINTSIKTEGDRKRDNRDDINIENIKTPLSLDVNKEMDYDLNPITSHDDIYQFSSNIFNPNSRTDSPSFHSSCLNTDYPSETLSALYYLHDSPIGLLPHPAPSLISSFILGDTSPPLSPSHSPIIDSPKPEEITEISSLTDLPAPENIENSENIEVDTNLYCFCRQPFTNDDFMICCDGCQEWYHGRCVNINEDKANSLDSWFCSSCIQPKAKKTKVKKDKKPAGSQTKETPPRKKTKYHSVEKAPKVEKEKLKSPIKDKNAQNYLLMMEKTRQTVIQSLNSLDLPLMMSKTIEESYFKQYAPLAENISVKMLLDSDLPPRSVSLYKDRIRCLLSALRDPNNTLKQSLVDQSLDPSRLSSLKMEEFAPDSLKQWREQREQHLLDEIVRPAPLIKPTYSYESTLNQENIASSITSPLSTIGEIKIKEKDQDEILPTSPISTHTPIDSSTTLTSPLSTISSHSSTSSQVIWQGQLAKAGSASFLVSCHQLAGPAINSLPLPHSASIVGRIKMGSIQDFLPQAIKSLNKKVILLDFHPWLPVSSNHPQYSILLEPYHQFCKYYQTKQKAAVCDHESDLGIMIYLLPPSIPSCPTIADSVIQETFHVERPKDVLWGVCIMSNASYQKSCHCSHYKSWATPNLLSSNSTLASSNSISNSNTAISLQIQPKQSTSSLSSLTHYPPNHNSDPNYSSQPISISPSYSQSQSHHSSYYNPLHQHQHQLTSSNLSTNPRYPIPKQTHSHSYPYNRASSAYSQIYEIPIQPRAPPTAPSTIPKSLSLSLSSSIFQNSHDYRYPSYFS